MAGAFNPRDNAGATSVRPPHVNTDAGVQRWFTNDAGGTRTHDQDLNYIIAQFRDVVSAFQMLDTEGDDTLLREAIKRVHTPRHNFVVNPSFDVWQAGIGQSGAVGLSTYSHADMWKIRGATNNAYTRQPGFAGAKYCMRVQTVAGQNGTSTTRVGQAFSPELAEQLAGRRIRVSADVRAGANFSGTGVILTIASGTAAGEAMDMNSTTVPFATGSAVTSPAPVPISSVSQRIVFPADYTVPADAKAVGIMVRYTGVGTAAAADYFEITNIKLETTEIPNSTIFIPEPLGLTLLRCQRYYQKSFNLDTAPAQNLGAGTGEFSFPAPVAGANAERAPRIIFPVAMRGAPSITLFNPAAANGQVRDLTAGADCSSAAVANISEKGFNISCTGNASTAVGNWLGAHWVADARSL